MRFIPLGRESPKVADCYVWTVKKFGCGGNFVMNRKDIFERMIKDQGTTFWFRFWLNFTLNTIFPLFNKINFCNKNGLKNEISSLAIEVHKKFLEVSEEKRIQFSVNVVQLLLTPPPMNADLFEMCIQYYTMAFATALCDVFHKWLSAPKIQKTNETYWKIPIKYRNPEFVPSRIEKYIVFVWGEEVSALLGLQKYDLPKLLTLGVDVYDSPVVQKIHKAFENVLPNEVILNSPQLAQYKLRVQQKIVEISKLIQKTDERPNVIRKISLKRKQNQSELIKVVSKPKKSAEYPNIETIQRPITVETILNAMKVETIPGPKLISPILKPKLIVPVLKPKLIVPVLRPKLIAPVLKPQLIAHVQRPKLITPVLKPKLRRPETTETQARVGSIHIPINFEPQKLLRPVLSQNRPAITELQSKIKTFPISLNVEPKQETIEIMADIDDIIESDLTYRLEKLKTWLEDRSPNRNYTSYKIRPNAGQGQTRIPKIVSLSRGSISQTDNKEEVKCTSSVKPVPTAAIENNTPKTNPDFTKLRKTKSIPHISIKVGSVLHYFNQHPTLDSLLIIFAAILLFYGRVVLNIVS